MTPRDKNNTCPNVWQKELGFLSVQNVDKRRNDLSYLFFVFNYWRVFRHLEIFQVWPLN